LRWAVHLIELGETKSRKYWWGNLFEKIWEIKDDAKKKL
jgi:hypothetical protein